MYSDGFGNTNSTINVIFLLLFYVLIELHENTVLKRQE